MNINDISTQLLFTTVPIWVQKGGETVSATAFFYNVSTGVEDQVVPLLITNHHVVDGGERALIEVVTSKDGAPDPERRIKVEVPGSALSVHTSPDLDLAALTAGPFLNQAQAAGQPLFFRSVDESLIPNDEAWRDLSALEEVVLIGYPSGLRDTTNATPLIRRGITATPVWNDYEGEPRFLIDAGVFPGSSGSPVFILNQGAYPTRGALVVGNRVHFLGVVTDAMVRQETPGHVFLGLGGVVNASAVRDFARGVALKVAAHEHTP